MLDRRTVDYPWPVPCAESVHIRATVWRVAEVVQIDGFRDTPTVVVPAQTMNCPPTFRLECGPEGFRPVCMRHALEVLADRGIGAIAIERRSSAPIARDRSCRVPAACPRSGR